MADTRARLVHAPALILDGSWIGREIAVGDHYGVLSDVDQWTTHHRTVLWLSGQRIDVHQNTAVIYDTLGAVK